MAKLEVGGGTNKAQEPGEWEGGWTGPPRVGGRNREQTKREKGHEHTGPRPRNKALWGSKETGRSWVQVKVKASPAEKVGWGLQGESIRRFKTN